MQILLWIVFLHRDGNFLDLVDSQVGGRAERSDDGLGVEPLLHVRFELLQELGCQEGDRGGAISNLRKEIGEDLNTSQFKQLLASSGQNCSYLSILGPCDIDKGLGRRMNNIQ